MRVLAMHKGRAFTQLSAHALCSIFLDMAFLSGLLVFARTWFSGECLVLVAPLPEEQSLLFFPCVWRSQFVPFFSLEFLFNGIYIVFFLQVA